MIFSSCSYFSEKIQGAKKLVSDSVSLDTASFVVKSIFYEGKNEKLEWSRLGDSAQFFKEFEENNKLSILKLAEEGQKTWFKDSLSSFNLDFDSVSVVGPRDNMNLTFYSTTQNVLFTIEKMFFVHLESNKVLSKSIKIRQKLLSGNSDNYEINYKYTY